MTDIHPLERTLLDNLPWNKARIKFVARFLLALYAMRTVNLSILATAFSGHAKEKSNYKRLQRFLREFKMPYAKLATFIVKLLGVVRRAHNRVFIGRSRIRRTRLVSLS